MKSNTIKALSAAGALALAAALPATSYAAEGNDAFIMDWNAGPHAPDQPSAQPNTYSGNSVAIMDWNAGPHALTQPNAQPNAASGNTAAIMDWNAGPHALTQPNPQPNSNSNTGSHAVGQ
jgi:hypothetical protein